MKARRSADHEFWEGIAPPRKSKLTLYEAVEQVCEIIEEHLVSLPPEERKKRRKTFHNYTARTCKEGKKKTS